MAEQVTSTPRDSREQLADQQAAVVRALNDGNVKAPAGFDLSKLRLAGESLARKRMRCVQKSWPATATALGEEFARFFTSYAADIPTPENPEVDGYNFVRWLKNRSQLPLQGRIELMQRQLTDGGVPLRLAWQRRQKLLIGLRWRRAVDIFCL